MQARHPSCKEYVKQRRAPLFLNGLKVHIGARYVVNLFVCECDLIADQVTRLDPSMDVSDIHTSLRLHLNLDPARRAHHRRRTCVL